jgi:hypothetical protein
MYRCMSNLPIIIDNPIIINDSYSHEDNIIREGRTFLKNWIKQCTTINNRPYMRFQGGRLFLDWVEGHIEKKKKIEKAARYQLMPCVRELLENTTDKPTFERKENNQEKFKLEGVTPRITPIPYGSKFLVIIAVPLKKNRGEPFLNTWHIFR